MLGKFLAGAVLAAVVSATPAMAENSAPPPGKTVDPNEIVCEKQEVMGSRLGSKRVCMTDGMVLKFTRTGKFVLQIGKSGPMTDSKDMTQLGRAADMVVDPATNELFVADGYFNHRVVVFDAETGKFKRAWGAYGKKPDDSYKFPPRAQLIAGDPPPQFNNPVHAAFDFVLPRT